MTTNKYKLLFSPIKKTRNKIKKQMKNYKK